MKRLEEVLAAITPLDENAMTKAQERIDILTKPPGSLGRLESMAVQVAGITGHPLPHLPARKTCILMAADHGVAAEGVSAFPQEVTEQMVFNFARGGAAINVLSRQVGAELVLVDIGVAAKLPELPGLLLRKVAYGSANFSRGPAMSLDEARRAVEVGIEVAEDCIAAGSDLLGTGEMGIANTTPSTAMVAFYSGLPVSQVVGRGTGIDDQRLLLKVNAAERALEVNKPWGLGALETLAALGGLEIAGLCGVMLAAAAHRVPVMVDGFISGAAALAAVHFNPLVKGYLIASHLSQEPGHRITLETLGLNPVLHMDMRLGEGTGAVLAMPLVEGALRIINEMATFGEAGVSGAV